MAHPDAIPLPDGTTLWRAPHAGAAFDGLVRLAADATGPDSLDFVGHYRKGVLDFSVATPGSVALDHDDATAPEPRPLLERIGRQLNFVHTRVDRALDTVRSGRLIRMVLRFEKGAVFYGLVRPGQYVVTSRHDADPEALDLADRATSDLVDAMRSLLRLGSQNPGGFASENLTDLAAGFDAAWRPRSHGDTASHTEKLVLCEEAIRPDDVHYVAYFHDRRLVFATDLLDHPSLAPFFAYIGADERRQRYVEVGQLLHLVCSQLNNSLLRTLGGPLDQLVADVEEGAVFYVRLTDDEFLVGVTLDQSRVAVADRVLRLLAESLAVDSASSQAAVRAPGDVLP